MNHLPPRSNSLTSDETAGEPCYYLLKMENEEAKTLLALVARGDQRAFQTLYRAQSRSVYAFVLNQFRNTVEAEEVLSETMFDLWKSAAKFKGESTVRTWIFGIARNKMLMHFRGQSAARKGAHEDVDDYAEILGDDRPDAIALIADTQRQHGVRKCMDTLSATHRECLHLVYFEGCSITEVVEIQQVASGTVKTRLHHARLKIKACLAALLGAEREPIAGQMP